MNQSEQINELAEALAKAQGEMPPIPKTKTAGTGRYSYNYADIADVLDAVRPVLSKHDIALTQAVEGVDAITTTLMHKSGQWMSSSMTFIVGGGNMSPMQQMGSSITYARRYSLSAVLGIQADDDTDNAEQRPQKGEKVTTKAGTYLGKASGRAPQSVAQAVHEMTDELNAADESANETERAASLFANNLSELIGLKEAEQTQAILTDMESREDYKDLRRAVWRHLADDEKEYIRAL